MYRNGTLSGDRTPSGGWCGPLAKYTFRAILVPLCLALGLLSALPAPVALASVRDAQGTVTSSPTSGPVRATIVVSGSGWQGIADGTSVTFGYGVDTSCSGYTPVADSQPGTMNGGAFNGWFRWPPTSLGTYAVCAAIGSGTIMFTNTYTVLSTSQAQVSISASTLTVGQQAAVAGTNYLPSGSTVNLVLQSANGGNSVSLGSVLSDANGSFSKTFAMPANPTGSDQILADVGGGSPPTLSSSVTFTVNPAHGPTPTPAATPQVTPTVTPTRTASATPTARPTGSATTPVATAGAGQTPVPTSSSGNPQDDTGATSTGQSSIDLPFPLIAIGAGALMIVVAVLGVMLFRRRQEQRRIDARMRARRFIPEPLPLVRDLSPWNEMEESIGNRQLVWNTSVPANTPLPVNTPIPAMNEGQVQSIPASSLNQPGESISLEPEPPSLDPFLEAMMRQAQAGLFVVPTRSKEPIQQS